MSLRPTRVRAAAWRITLVLAGVATAIGGSQHPSSDAEDSLRDELATMTSSDSWVFSHTMLALGTALLALGLWLGVRARSWPTSTRTALRMAAIGMSAYVVETLFHLASVVDSDALADGDAAPVAFTHVGLALFLYPLSGALFARLNVRLVRAVPFPEKFFGVLGVVAGVIHGASVPLTVVFPDAELTPMFAGAGMLLALWSVGIGLIGVGPTTTGERGGTPGDETAPRAATAARTESSDASGRSIAYRSAERRLWHSLGIEVRDYTTFLPRLGTRVRIQEVGSGRPTLFVHGGPNAGTTWAPLVARMPDQRSILLDRPGSGLSEPVDIDPGRLGEFADHLIVDLLDALELERADVVASSFGGFLALRAAAVAPHRFDRMVQMACPAGAPAMSVPPFMRAAAIAPLRSLITTIPPNERAARSMLRQIGHGASVDAGRFSPEFMSWYLSLQRHTDTMRNDLALVGSLVSVRGAVHPALTMSDEFLCGIDVPTFFYWGEDDPFGGVDVARKMIATMGDARLEMVPDAGHLPWLDDPARTARSVLGFLDADVDRPRPIGTVAT